MSETHETRACRGHHRGDFTLPGAEPHYPPDLVLEPVHLDIDYHVDLAKRTVDGTVTHTVRARRDGARTIVLHAVDFQDVRVQDGDGADVTQRYDGKEIRVTWQKPFDEGEERRLAVSIRLDNPQTGLFFSSPSETFPDHAWYAATDNETERARHWLPTIDLPAVRPTLTWHLRAEERFTILAGGSFEREEVHGDGTKTSHWRLDQPCPSYLTCFTIGEFVRHEQGEFGGRPVASFTTNRFTEADLERAFGRTGEMLAWMEKKLGHSFPYPKYYQFALPGFGGAMENISLVAWDDQFVLDEQLAHEWTWLVDQINVHEMAHSYFGDMITCRDFAHAWLKESWATYMETLWLEDSKSYDEMQYDVFSNIERYCTEADERYKRPIVTREFNHSWQMYDGHLYPGGASRLHMLRKELGDETFFDGVRTYVSRFAFKTVETSDFRRTLEEVSGRSLVRWFDQWIHGKGYPKVKASFKFDAEKKEAAFELEQTQPDKKTGKPLFDLSLDLAWTCEGASCMKTVKLEKAKQTFIVAMDKEPEVVRVDPECRVVMRLEFDPGEKKLLAQLTGAADPYGRILAARTLLDGGKQRRVDKVLDAYRNESFWGVRVRMAEALSKAATDAALEGLATLIGEEQDGMVLESLIRTAGKHRHDGVRDAIVRRLDAGIDLYRARFGAFNALGRQRERAPFDRFVAQSAEPGDPYGYAQRGALEGAAASRDERAVEVIDARTAPGSCTRGVRPTAVRELGTAGRWLERHRRPAVRERLEELLRDPVDRVRDAAVSGLARLRDPAAIPALTSYRGGVSEQERPDVDRAIAGLRKSAEPTEKAKDKAMDDLRARLRKLESVVDGLATRVDPPKDA